MQPLADHYETGMFFAARHEVMLQLMRLAAHCRDFWARRLQAPTRMRPQHNKRFLMDYFPRPPKGGHPLLPYSFVYHEQNENNVFCSSKMNP